LFNKRADELKDAIIAESARWGGSKGTFPPRTKDDDWVPELNGIRNDFFPVRSDILIEQLKLAGLYPDLMPSEILVNGNKITSEDFTFRGSVTLAFRNPNTSGTMYYTLDNSDPRLTGGSVNPAANIWNQINGINVSSSTIIKTRIYRNGTWSAMNRTNLLKADEDYSGLKITEIMYHPNDTIIGTDTIPGTSLEFIEFKNTGSSGLNISGMILDSAIHCVFPSNTILAPGQFFVIASKPGAFTGFYGMEPSSNFSGNLANSGEYILLTDSKGEKVISLTYDDKDPWPDEADGFGYSLTSYVNNPKGDPDNYFYWKSSSMVSGSPFADDDYSDTIEKLDPDLFRISIYPNPASEEILIKINELSTYKNAAIKIFTFSGKLVYYNELNKSNPIELKSYGITQGFYLVRVEADGLIATARLVVINNR
jgi:hypothetical protein